MMNAQQIVSLDIGKVGEDLVSRFPWIANPILKGALGFLSPFHRALGLHLVRWERRMAEGEIRVRRRLRDHNGALHAGAIGLAGETLALLVLLRNVRLTQYAVELKEVSTMYDAPVKSSAALKCELDAESFARIKQALGQKGEALVRLRTDITDGHIAAATVRTVWRVHPRFRKH
ncbi:MAG: YiiD C-terminal domain-containing protein [Bdellovibrionales bacterium]|nr:YiiD C-terminal domain-containing protein [Bdellovibrionales bacterium]